MEQQPPRKRSSDQYDKGVAKRPRQDAGGGLKSLSVPSYKDIWPQQQDLKTCAWHKSTAFTRPEFVTGYERTRDGRFLKEGRNATSRTYKPASVGSDLNEGMDKFVSKREDSPEDKGSLANIWKTFAAGFNNNTLPHICTFRNNLNKILETPFQKRDAWKMGVRKASNGILFLDVHQIEQQPQDAEKQKALQRFIYYGYKFESLSTVPDDNDDGVVDANEEYCGLFRTKLASHQLLIGAEMDCSQPNRPKDFVELKTSRIISHEKQRRTFERHKLLKYWIQSFLVGTGSIVVGFRDDDGILRKIERLETAKLPRIGFEKRHWSANTCLQFAHRVLDLLREQVQDETKSYVLEYKAPFREVTLRLAEIPAEEVDLSFLSD